MFWNHSRWQKYTVGGDTGVDQGLSLLSAQNSQLARAIAGFQPSRSAGPDPGPDKSSTGKLRLSQIRWIILDFYIQKDGKRPILVNLTLNRGESNSADLFFVTYWTDSASPSVSSSGPPSPLPGQECVVSVLSGLSESIHRISAVYGVDLGKAEEFADFFCSFIDGDDGPFGVIQSLTDVRWAKNVKRILDGEVQEKILGRLPNRSAPYQPLARFEDCKQAIELLLKGFKTARVSFDPANLEATPITDFYQVPGLSRRAQKAKKEKIVATFSQSPSLNSPKFVHLRLAIQYGRSLFLALLQVYADGRVDMVEDRPLHPLAGNLPIRSFKFERALNVGDFRFLVDFPYETIDVATLLDTASSETGKHKSDMKSKNGNSSVLMIGPGNEENQNQHQGGLFVRALHFTGVDFLGDLSFENAVFRGNVTFESCRFFGKVNFSNARVGGALKFDRCWFFGLPSKPSGDDDSAIGAGGQVRPAEDKPWCADFEGAVVSRSLILHRCQFKDSLSFNHIHVEGKTRFEGCRIEPLYDAALMPAVGIHIPLYDRFQLPHFASAALDLRYGRFDSGLDLAADYAPLKDFAGSATNQVRSNPTVVVGPVRGEHSVIKGGLSLGGLITCQLNASLFTNIRPWWTGVTLEHSEIQGGLRAWSPGGDPLEQYHLMRTVINGSLELSHCKVFGGIDLRGAWVGGNLQGSGLQCDSFFSLAAISQAELESVGDSSYLELSVAGEHEQLVYDFNAPVLIIERGTDDESVSCRMARFGRTHIAGHVDLTEASCNTLALDGCCVEGTIYCDGGEFTEIVAWPTISAIRDNSDLKPFLQGNKKTGNEGLSENPFTEYLEKRRARSVHALRPSVNSQNSLEASFALSSQDRLIGLIVMNCEIQGFRMRDAHVAGRLWMHAVLVGVDLAADLDSVWQGDELIDEVFRTPNIDSRQPLAEKMAGFLTALAPAETALEIQNCVIEGPVLIFDPAFSKEWLFRQASSRVGAVDELWKVLNGTSSPPPRPADQLARLTTQLAASLAAIDRSRVHGDVRVENTLIDGKLFLSNIEVRGSVEIKDVVLKSDLVAGCQRQHFESGGLAPASWVTTEAVSLDLEMLDCDGDVLLPGLRLSKGLSARNLHVRGYFELLSQGDRGRKATTAPERRGIAGCSAIIGGNVDLGGSQLGWLQCILTCPLENRHGNKDEWCLEQSTVKRLVFFDPLPNGINIRGAECSAIEIPREGEENVRKNLYRVCQPNTEFIAMDERLLRREGDFEKANHAYAQHQRTLNSGFVGAVRAGIFRFAANPWSPFICALALVVLWAFAWTLTYFPQNWTLDHPPGSDKLSASQPNSPTSAAPTALSNPGAPSTVSAASTPVKPPDSVLPAWQNGHFVWRAFDIAIPVVHVQSYTSGGETRLKDLGPTTIGPWHLPISPGFVASLISGFGWVWGSLLLVTLSGVAKRE